MDIREAVSKLDKENDDHWTGDGLPSMKAVENLVGDSSIKRKDVTQVVGDFRRGDELPAEEVEEEKTEEPVKEDPVEEPAPAKVSPNGPKIKQASLAEVIAMQRKQDALIKQRQRDERRASVIAEIKEIWPTLSADEKKEITGV